MSDGEVKEADRRGRGGREGRMGGGGEAVAAQRASRASKWEEGAGWAEEKKEEGEPHQVCGDENPALVLLQLGHGLQPLVLSQTT